MDHLRYKTSFDTLLGVKPTPNTHEVGLFERAKKYIQKITWIPGLRLVAVANSLSMYATHPDSDIDLFIVTAKDRIWIVRLFITTIFFLSGVWRRGEDIAGNFCLSFWIDERSLDLSSIALEDDIYLASWIASLKPIYDRGDTYRSFVEANAWIEISESTRRENLVYLLPLGRADGSSIHIFGGALTLLNSFIRYFGEKKARSTYQKKGSPSGVIIRPDMLKFHDRDRRALIRDSIIPRSR